MNFGGFGGSGMGFGGMGLGGFGTTGGAPGAAGSSGLSGTMPTGTMPTGAMQMGGMHQMQMSMPMGMLPMGMPMGMPVVGMMGMGMPMGVPMGMGMMGMSGMSGMPMGVSPLLAAAAQHEQNKSEAEAKKEKLLKALEAAGEQLAAREAKASSSSSGPQRREDAEASHARGTGGGSAPPPPAAAEEEKAPPKCHLHKKPNAKCKFCQKAELHSAARAAASVVGSAAASGSGDGGGADRAAGSGAGGERGGHAGHSAEGKDEDEDYSKRHFNCSPMLKDQILSSSYFKSLLSIENVDDLVEEIAQYADTLDVYNAGSNTQPSCFICQAYRLFTMPKAEDLSEVQSILDYPHSAVVRCVGFVYMRFVLHPNHLWGKLEEYLFDTMELSYSQSGKQMFSTVGEYVEQLLIRDRYFNTPLPRIPVKVRQILEKELAPLHQYRKRMEANRKTFKGKKVADMPVEVCIDGKWVCGLALELVGRLSTAKKLRVQLDDGSDVNVHLGKVILRSRSRSRSRSGSSEGGRRKRRRSGSPDWSRFKGQSEQEMVEELRKRAQEEATIGHGRAYPKRPQHVDMGLAQKFERGSHEQRLLEEDRTAHDRARGEHRQAETESCRRLRLEEEEKRQKKLRDIYEKYGAQQQKTPQTTNYGASSTKKKLDVEGPDVLRLG